MKQKADGSKLVDLRGVLPMSLHCVVPLVERVLGLGELNNYYAQCSQQAAVRKESFCRVALDCLGMRYDVAAGDLVRIPEKGPLVIVANHPVGAPEALVLGDVLERLRPDYKFLGNFLLERVVELRHRVIAVDPFGGESAAKANVRAMRSCLEHLAGGGTLVVFPAGAVSHLDVRQGTVTDPEWSEHIGRLIRRSGATVVPAYFDARNSWVFQLAGLLHPLLRTLLLPREFMRCRGGLMRAAFGKPQSASRLSQLATDKAMMDFLRAAVYVQQGRLETVRQSAEEVVGAGEVVVEAVDASILAGEIALLQPQRLLFGQSGFQVFAAPADEIPNVLREIGRLREITFRAVGEGTGKALDIESYDQHYVHLFIWNELTREVVGAYRLGLVDEILAQCGGRGLYTASLFRYRPGFLRGLGPALELGRSFIRPEYQRKYQSLMLLWRGIGEFVARNPAYAVLFGPVSISRDYHALSRNLLVQFLRRRNSSAWLKWQVRATKPPRRHHVPGLNASWFARRVEGIEEVSALVAEIEKDGKGIPVLLRHYLKLNATLVGFNVDPAFSDVLDGLIMLDLRNCEPKVLQRFMSAEGAARFADYHEMRDNAGRQMSAVVHQTL